MSSIKEKIAKTKKFYLNNSLEISCAISFITAVYASAVALKVIRDAMATSGTWKLVMTDEIRERLNVEGAKIQTFVVLGETPSYAIVTPK